VSGRPPGPDVAPSGLAGRRVVVVGAGVAGASLAWAAARAGADVTVLEADPRGAAGASGLPVALVNPYRGRTGSALAGDVRGARTAWRWSAALEALGLESGAARRGVVRAASDARQRRSWERLVGVRHVEAGTLGPFRLPHGGFVVDAGGWIDAVAWLRALDDAAEREGVARVLGARAEAIERRGASLAVTSSAGALRADLVALCIGASDPGSLPAVPLRRVAGEVVLTPHPPIPHALAGGVYAAPAPRPSASAGAGGPFLAIGGNHRERSGEPARPEDARRLLSSVRWVLPSVGDEVAALWSGVRARGPVPEPVVREVTPGVWWVGAFAGRGFLRAASTAEEVVTSWSRSAG
jgi:glycine/D-amino acid oxidase-like deaminating enzyme